MANAAHIDEHDVTAQVNLDLTNKIAFGGHSDVYKGTMDGRPVAVKMPRVSATQMTDKKLQELLKEIAVWTGLSHPHILPMLGLYIRSEWPNYPGIVSPWCESGTMVDYLENLRAERATGGNPSNGDVVRFRDLEVELLCQVADGLAYLHAKDHIHGDVKGKNVLVWKGAAMLSDFGFSVTVADRSGSDSSKFATTRWLAPESNHAGWHRSQAADVWAFGCVILEARTLEVPYQDVKEEKDVSKAIESQQLPWTRPNGMHAKVWRLATDCWSFQPASRPTAHDVRARLEIVLKSKGLETEASGAMQTLNDCVANVRSCSAEDLDLSETERLLNTEGGAEALLSVPSAEKTIQVLLDVFLARAQRLRNVKLNESKPVFQQLHESAVTLARLLEHSEFASDIRRPPHEVRPLAKLVAGKNDKESRRAREMMQLISTPEITNVELPDGSTVHSMRVANLDDGPHVVAACGTIGEARGTRRTAITGYQRDPLPRIRVYYVTEREQGHGATLSLRSPNPQILSGHKDRISSVDCSLDGRRIISSSDDSTIRSWHHDPKANAFVERKKLIDSVRDSRIYAVSLSSSYVASGSYNLTKGRGELWVWNQKGMNAVHGPLLGHRSAITTVCFSPDEKFVASGSEDQTIRIWQISPRTAKPVGDPLREHYGAVNAVLYSLDGGRIFSASNDGTILVWDARKGEKLDRISVSDGPVLAIALSPDGTRIATASEGRPEGSEGAVQLWDVAIGSKVSGAYGGHKSAARAVAFFPDGKRLVSGGDDGKIRVWDCSDSWMKYK